MSYSYQTTKVHTSNWHEEAAWRPDDGVRPSATVGARRFGQVSELTPAQTLARSSGHDTRNLTSWGQETAMFDGSCGDFAPTRPSRRGIIHPPEKPDVKLAVAGEGLAEGEEEVQHYATGQVSTPGTGRAVSMASAIGTSHEPFATESDPPLPGPPVLFDSISGVAKSTGRGLGVVSTEPSLPASSRTPPTRARPQPMGQ